MHLSKLFGQLAILFWIILFTTVAGHDYLKSGFPYTHDGENHLARFANYKIALKEGQFPPRLAPNLFNHYGYPVFNYNYPLANILSLPFSLVGFNYDVTFKILLFSFLVFGGFGVVRWLKSLSTNNKVATSALVFVLGIYYSSHYLINAVLYRGNIGEIMAFCLFPWIMIWLNNKTFSPFFVLIWVAFLLSHNIMAFFGLIICLIVWLLNYKKHLEVIKKEILFFGLIFGLISWFWWPAILELNLVAASHSQLVTAATAHFPTLRQLFFAPLQFGFSYPGGVDSLAFSLGFIQWAVIIATFSTLFFKGTKTVKLLPKKYFILFFITVFLQLPISLPIWQALPMLNLLQFPWRFSFLLLFCFYPLLGMYLRTPQPN